MAYETMTAPTFTANELEKAHNSASGKTVENIDITKAANGFTARVRYAHKRATKRDECVPYEEPETLVFADTASLVEWLEGLLA